MDDIFLFEGFRFDPHGGGLFRRDEHGVFVPIAIGSRALEVLGVLVGRPGDLVSRDEIIAAVWPSTTVEDSNLNMQIGALRRVLDAGRTEGSWIQTIPGRGYRFVAPVKRVEQTMPPASTSGSGNGAGEPIAETVASSGTGKPSRPRGILILRGQHSLWAGIIATVVTAVVFVAVVGAGNWRSHRPGDTHLAPRLSIVVLPLTNLSNDPEQQYFADALTEDITTDLSRIANMFVISHNTAFTYRNKPVDAKQIGRDLGVRYVLEGSVQRSGNQVRVNAQLIAAETDAHLWAERFDRDTGDLFALQNEITGRIANTLSQELTRAEAGRPTADPDALDYTLRGRAAFQKGTARENYAEAISLFERALALDPSGVEPKTFLSWARVDRVGDGISDSVAADLARAAALVDQALAASPRYAFAHFVKGQILRVQRRCEEALPEYETVIALDRNNAAGLFNVGRCKVLTGSLDEAIPLMEQAIRLNPSHPYIGFYYFSMGQVHLLQSRTDEAIVWLEKARSANPGYRPIHGFLASAYALKGDVERAAAELAEARRLSRDDRYMSIARLRAVVGYWGVPKVQALFETTFFVGLRKAGMPEQ